MLASALRPFRPAAIALALGAAMPPGIAAAADVLVVTDSRHPVQAPAGTRIVELDRAARLEADLAAGLPNAPDAASVIVRQRLQAGGDVLQQRLARAWQDVTDTWSLGVAKLPAVVVDRRYVVYGETDIAGALARIAAYRSAHP